MALIVQQSVASRVVQIRKHDCQANKITIYDISG